MKSLLNLSALTLSIAAIVGCGSPRSISVTSGTPLAKSTPSEPSTPAAPAFTVTLQMPATVQAPPACPSSCIGLGYDGLLNLPLQLTSNGFIGRVQLTVIGASAGIFAPDLPPVVDLDYGNSPANVVVSIPVFAMPGLAAGEYQLTIVAKPLAGSNSAAAVSLPVTLKVVSGAAAAWRAQ